MPSLTPVTEASESLVALSEGSETLDLLVERNVGFYPGISLVDAPVPYPSNSTYPGLAVPILGLTVMTES